MINNEGMTGLQVLLLAAVFWLVVQTLIGSACGAILLVMVPPESLPIVVSAAMIGVAIFSLIYRQAGADEATISFLGSRQRRTSQSLKAL